MALASLGPGWYLRRIDKSAEGTSHRFRFTPVVALICDELARVQPVLNRHSDVEADPRFKTGESSHGPLEVHNLAHDPEAPTEDIVHLDQLRRCRCNPARVLLCPHCGGRNDRWDAHFLGDQAGLLDSHFP